MAKEAWYINESELDDYQIPIIQKRMDSSFIVRGCAGSGKTVLALWKAREIAESDLGSYYFIVFTKSLRQFINDGVDEVGLEHNRVLYHYQWKNRMNKPQADYIIIDEVQDFSRDELSELQSAAKKAFILFGDSAQQIFEGLKSNLLTMQEISYHTQLPMEPLVLNHRLPKKIARVAEHLNSTGDRLEGRCQKEGASRPHLIKADSFKQELNYILDTIDSEGYTDVCILLHSNELVKEAYDFFIEKDFKAEAKYDISYPDNMMFNLNFRSENPKLMTYHSAKGLQFEAVFIPNCNDGSIKRKHLNALYVAATRSYQDLFFSYSGTLTSYLSDIPKSLFEEVKLDDDFEDLPF